MVPAGALHKTIQGSQSDGQVDIGADRLVKKGHLICESERMTDPQPEEKILGTVFEPSLQCISGETLARICAARLPLGEEGGKGHHPVSQTGGRVRIMDDETTIEIGEMEAVA